MPATLASEKAKVRVHMGGIYTDGNDVPKKVGVKRGSSERQGPQRV